MDLQRIRRIGACAAILAGSTLMVACSTPPASTSVSGTATYRERIALPPQAVFEARLEDVSLVDAPAVLVAQVRDESPGAPPFHFTIPYDPARIQPSHRYAISARVLHGDELLFASDTHVALPTGPDAAPVQIMMVAAGARSRGSAARSAGPVLMRGLYSYRADAGLFTDCATGERLPVAQAHDNAALEAAYTGTRSEPGAPLLATVIGRIEDRQGMEGGVRPTLLVEHFVNLAAASCDRPRAATLEDSYWELAALDGAPIALAAGQRAPYLVLASRDHRVSGYAGCNRLMGGYTLAGSKLSFTQLAGTMMACAQGMDLEQQLHAALTRVAGWRLAAGDLELLDAGGSAVARLENR